MKNQFLSCFNAASQVMLSVHGSEWGTYSLKIGAYGERIEFGLQTDKRLGRAVLKVHVIQHLASEHQTQ